MELLFSWKLDFSSCLEWNRILADGPVIDIMIRNQMKIKILLVSSVSLTSLDPLFLCWKAVILLDVIFLCDSMLALGIRCKVHWCSWRQAFYFKSNQCPLGTLAFCLLLNFKKCAGDSPPHLAAPCHLVVITVLRFFHAMKTAVWERVFAHPLVFLFQV